MEILHHSNNLIIITYIKIVVLNKRVVLDFTYILSNTLQKEVTWKSDNSKIVIIDKSGGENVEEN